MIRSLLPQLYVVSIYDVKYVMASYNFDEVGSILMNFSRISFVAVVSKRWWWCYV